MLSNSTPTETDADIDIHPLAVATRDAAFPTVPLVIACTAGVAANHTDKGNATVIRYGAAVTTRGGTADGGANGVALAHGGGLALAGDGGIAAAKSGGDASCGSFGVAYSSTPRDRPGRVRGGAGSVLVLVWKIAGVDHGVNARVGDTVDGVSITPNVWYTYNIVGARWMVAKQP